MFLILAILGGFYLLFRFYREGQSIGWNRVLVMLFVTVYAIVYLYVPPFLGMSNQYAGKMYELIPIGCYLVSLVPDMEEASTEEKFIVFFAWCGFIFIASFLAYFKLYVW
ncbi:MAG: hypothetical protein ACI808_001572 [Paraglaciecola sp.]|jgi:hypothetical protein